MLPNERPPRGTCQDYEGDAAYLQVLLMADAPVGREQQVEPCRSAAFKTSCNGSSAAFSDRITSFKTMKARTRID
jgi:hypothetical protein